MDPYKQLENKLGRIRADAGITDKNKLFLQKFRDRCLAESMSPRRILKYMNYMAQHAFVLGEDFDLATKEDIQRLIAEIERKNWAEWTKYDNKMMIKTFYKWLEGEEEVYPKKVSWIKPKIKRNKLIEPHELLTDEDVKAMIQTASSIRDKAFVSVLYESGCRISELLNMKVKDAVQDDFGYVIHVAGKTGPRRIRLIDSVPFLATWTANHPKNDREAPLWVCVGTRHNGMQLGYNTISHILKALARDVGIQKPVNPHAWRKASSTKLASKGMGEFELKRRQGWVPSSRVAEVYVRLSGKDDDDAYFRTMGICLSCKKNKAVRNNLCEECIGKPNLKINILEPKPCPRCGHKCEPTARMCSQCGFPLNDKVAEELLERRKKVDQIMNVMTQYPEVMSLFEKIMKERNLKAPDD